MYGPACVKDGILVNTTDVETLTRVTFGEGTAW